MIKDTESFFFPFFFNLVKVKILHFVVLELFWCQFYFFLTFLNLVSSIQDIYNLSKGFTCNNNQIIVHYFCSEYELIKFNYTHKTTKHNDKNKINIHTTIALPIHDIE